MAEHGVFDHNGHTLRTLAARMSVSAVRRAEPDVEALEGPAHNGPVAGRLGARGYRPRLRSTSPVMRA